MHTHKNREIPTRTVPGYHSIFLTTLSRVHFEISHSIMFLYPRPSTNAINDLKLKNDLCYNIS